MRGEHSATSKTALSANGSSPHARGTRQGAGHERTGKRFIPACAGNTLTTSKRWTISSVHPRMRGEHHCRRDSLRQNAGSSPHARGTLPRLDRCIASPRFIPACAGNTAHSDSEIGSSSVHPRMRGEHAVTAGAIFGGNGSSPHARGTHQIKALPDDVRRFIPACAGNTWYRRHQEDS